MTASDTPSSDARRLNVDVAELEPELVEEDEQRDDRRDRRQHQHAEDRDHQRLAAAELEARERVGRGDARGPTATAELTSAILRLLSISPRKLMSLLVGWASTLRYASR